MKRAKKEPKQGSWMDTYGDMVTLLLCFFVMLYSMSTVDQQKWITLVKSFNPNATESSQIVTDTNLPAGEDDVPGNIEKPEEITDEFDSLYLALQKSIQEQNMEDSVELTQGEDYTFVSFQDVIFFDGYSSVLKDGGKDILKSFGDLMGSVDESIQQIQVMGHTAQVNADIENEVHTDRLLSAQRSAEVAAFLEENSAITPSKIVSMGFGQYKPIADSSTTEGRAKNRRVEILITKDDAVVKSLQDYYSQVYEQ